MEARGRNCQLIIGWLQTCNKIGACPTRCYSSNGICAQVLNGDGRVRHDRTGRSVTCPEICPASCPRATEPNARIANSPTPKTSAVRLRRRLPANCPTLKLPKKRDMALMIVSSGELIEGLRPARFPKSFRSRRISSHFRKMQSICQTSKDSAEFKNVHTFQCAKRRKVSGYVNF